MSNPREFWIVTDTSSDGEERIEDTHWKNPEECLNKNDYVKLNVIHVREVLPDEITDTERSNYISRQSHKNKRTNQINPSDFNHPCKDICSGWKQGFEKGREAILNELRTMPYWFGGAMMTPKLVADFIEAKFKAEPQESKEIK